jgi:hypothetical protein
MKAIIVCLLVLGMLSYPGVALAETPHEVAGFRLGESIKKYENAIDKGTSVPMWQREYLSEVESKPIAGYKCVYLTYGTCDPNEPILRIKVKYERDDENFFDGLMTGFKKRFGEPSEYKGDVFRMVVAWKWTFTDKEGNQISMTLQRNNQDDEESPKGNSLKISMTNLVDRERRCYLKKHPELQKSRQGAGKSSSQIDIEQFIPK